MELDSINENGQERPAAKRRPVAEIPVGSIRAAIWRNETANGHLVFNVTFSRLYKDREGNWKNSDSIGRDELPLLSRAADVAHDWILSVEQQEEAE